MAWGPPTLPRDMRGACLPKSSMSHLAPRPEGCQELHLGKKSSLNCPPPCLLSGLPMLQPLKMINTFKTMRCTWSPLSPRPSNPTGLASSSFSVHMAPESSGKVPVPPPPPLGGGPQRQPFLPKDTFWHHICLTLCLPVFLFLVEFQSSSNNTSLRTHLGSSVTLDCRFALAPSSSLYSVEWRRQHRGSGHNLFQYRVGGTGPTVQPKVYVDVAELLGSGDASLSLQGVSVEDEGTYICLVSTLLHQAQHIIHLHVAGEEGKCPGGTGVPCQQALKLCPAPLSHGSQYSLSRAARLLSRVDRYFVLC